MIKVDEFAKMLAGEQDILMRQVEGLSHAESLIQPQPGGNCLNWVMGHLVVNLIDILSVLGQEAPGDFPDMARYRIGSEPILGEEEDGIVRLEELVNTYSSLSAQIADRLSQMSAEDFDEEMDFWQGKSRRGYVAFFYFFHNTYHLGQLEFLRNLAGKTEKVI
jgi:uncharacterized damage-inducible protein DinB